jgi:phosphatidylglycerophosphate synthase
VDQWSSARRPVAARGSRWAAAIARWLARKGLRPNHVSLLSVGFAGLAAVSLVLGSRSPFTWHAALFLLAAGFVELRLLCNLVDGMIAVEGGLGTASGPVFNELPDRISDSIILVSAGYAALGLSWAVVLGWSAALLAVLTAYVRALAGSLGAKQDFGGPMAKQQRMQLVVAACLLGTLAAGSMWSSWVLAAALGAIVAGSTLTVARRTLHLVRELESR